jgi:hypothetical protein
VNKRQAPVASSTLFKSKPLAVSDMAIRIQLHRAHRVLRVSLPARIIHQMGHPGRGDQRTSEFRKKSSHGVHGGHGTFSRGSSRFQDPPRHA